MKRNIKGELAAVCSVCLLGGFLLIKHSGLNLPLLNKQQQDYVPLGKVVLDGEYELAGDWLLRIPDTTEMTVCLNGKTVYREHLAGDECVAPVRLPGSAGGGYCRDLNGDGNDEFIVEAQTATGTDDAGLASSRRYDYTIYSVDKDGVTRYPSASFDDEVSFADENKDGVLEMISRDGAFRDFMNDKHLGAPLPVICEWNGSGFSFSQALMKKTPPSAAQLEKLAADVNAKIVRYDTTTPTGKQEKHIEIHPDAWQPVLELVYHGNSAAARKLLSKVWADDEYAVFDTAPDTKVSREDFWKSLWQQVNGSQYASAIRQMNNAQS